MRCRSWPRVRKRVRLLAGRTVTDFAVDCGTRDGKREIYFRSTRTDADALASSLRDARDRLGAQARLLTVAQVSDAAKALAILPADISLETVARAYVAHRAEVREVPTVAEAHAELLQSMADRNRRPRSLEAARGILKPFVADFGPQSMATITADRIQDWLRSRSEGRAPATAAGLCRYVRILFAFAVRKGRLSVNPTARLDAPEVPYRMPSFHSVDEVAKILNYAVAQDPDAVPKFAIGYFTGIRVAEMERLLWSDVDIPARVIVVRPEVAKSGMPRAVPIPENLAAWLLPFSARPATDRLPLCGRAFVLHRRRVCMETGVAWHQDVMRHSFVTYHMATHHDAPRTMDIIGHTRDPQLIYRHYRGFAKTVEAQATLYWSIAPESSAVIEFPVKQAG